MHRLIENGVIASLIMSYFRYNIIYKLVLVFLNKNFTLTISVFYSVVTILVILSNIFEFNAVKVISMKPLTYFKIFVRVLYNGQFYITGVGTFVYWIIINIQGCYLIRF